MSRREQLPKRLPRAWGWSVGTDRKKKDTHWRLASGRQIGPRGRDVAAPREGLYLAAAATADRHVVHHDAAGAAAIHHGGHGIAARLNHLTALGVAAGAGDAHAILGHLTLAHAHR